ncbi:hypothetical protein F4813DRAFT_398960 [Daldinia decipiens]|uniref:uncharacterized protein n=1 Tax=Daldinia decipiens TaxID=326647 RepID=UPI0020C22581|nr:uncharacterized protein F4813DRAFT_398960 [Daldinia decipiens]KAI1654430.1 hypothetical protein F4813DRAFT_398960 [Daldinia decipiens]
MQSSAPSLPHRSHSGKHVILRQAASQAGIDNIVLNLMELDFKKAFDFIREKLSPEFVQEYWLVSVVDASRCCYNEYGNVSVYWFCIKFLDTLWCLLFGRTAGPSPWYYLLDGLSMFHGAADEMIDVLDLNRKIFDNPNDANIIMHRELGQLIFPIKIAMPENITLTPSTGNSKRSAADDLDQPQTKTKRSSKDN